MERIARVAKVGRVPTGNKDGKRCKGAKVVRATQRSKSSEGCS